MRYEFRKHNKTHKKGNPKVLQYREEEVEDEGKLAERKPKHVY